MLVVTVAMCMGTSVAVATLLVSARKTPKACWSPWPISTRPWTTSMPSAMRTITATRSRRATVSPAMTDVSQKLFTHLNEKGGPLRIAKMPLLPHVAE